MDWVHEVNDTYICLSIVIEKENTDSLHQQTARRTIFSHKKLYNPAAICKKLQNMIFTELSLKMSLSFLAFTNMQLTFCNRPPSRLLLAITFSMSFWPGHLSCARKTVNLVFISSSSGNVHFLLVLAIFPFSFDWFHPWNNYSHY